MKKSRAEETRLYRHRHPEKVAEWRRKWRTKNKKRLAEQEHARREKDREHARELNRAFTRRLREQVFDLFGKRCVRCGFNDERALQLDHINGGGVREAKRLGGPKGVWRNSLENPDKYQILCANCNWIKRRENKEYPTGFEGKKP